MIKERIEKLEKCLADNCRHSTVLWFSGGKDSRLLLELMTRKRLKFDVFRFDHGWTREQKRSVDAIVTKHSIGALSYLPRFTYIFGDGDNLTIAFSYAVGVNGECAVVLRDLVDGTVCGAYDLKFALSERVRPPVRFANHIWGTRAADTHYATGALANDQEWVIGCARFFCPLWEWTDDDVLDALASIGVDYQAPSEQLDTGNISACTACLGGKGEVFCPKAQEMIPSIEWDPVDNLKRWRGAYGVGESNG